ncbi:hypothetical protein TruAng_011090 [Truncatella angustata]|nr:hypothetical protein TruAng_011090 [Truncatella angustata]
MASSPHAVKVEGLDDHDDLFADLDAPDVLGGLDGPEPSGLEDTTKQDDAELQNILNSLATEGNVTGLEGFDNKQIDQTDKDANAIDFEDLSDDDLASDEDVASQPGAAADISQVPGLTEDSGISNDVDMEGDADLDDLFGDQDGGNVDLPPSSPEITRDAQPAAPSSPVQARKEPITAANVTDDEWNTMSWEERFKLNFPQQEPNSVSAWVTDQTQHQDPSVPVPPQNIDELLKHKFPSFEEHKVLDFRELFPEWPAEYLYKEPPKSPAPLVPTKLELEIDVDTSKLFRIPDTALAATAASKRSQQQQFGDLPQWSNLTGPTLIDLDDALSDSDDEDELVGGYTMTEIATICEDWENINEAPTSLQLNGQLTPPAEEDEPMDDWEREFLGDRRPQPKKKRKYEPGLPSLASYQSAGISNFMEATKRAAHCIQLDQNDPYLLIEDMQMERPVKKARTEEKTRRMANGQLGRDVMHRFNHSNDAAYEALKANHKSKVRATLSNLDVEHSLPAQKLAFPFYRTKLNVEFWEHHRPKFDIASYIKYQVKFKKPAKVKRKELKGKPVPDVYKSSRDLSLNDNSNIVLFEYCEQSPILLNKFGMGSRIINYTRRHEGEEEPDKLPKAELGETQTLLPEDKSPFSIFGTVDIGEVVPTLHNALYRAPVFKHEQRSNDFILGFTITAKDAPYYYLRKAYSLQVVGQQNVFQEVPGPHARMITSTNKKRMRAICDRMARHRPTQDIDIREVTAHVFDKVDPQNRYQPRDDGSVGRIDPNDRQKMKEFYVYDKESKTWKYKEGDAPMDERTIRQQIKPEDVVLIEATQVGSATLQNAGYDPKAPSFADEDDELGTDTPLVAKLAPWELTKNFLDACQSKAMVALHGEGDPTGHGLGFSFIKTSMKGGYINAVQGPLATSADAIERERKANGGHSYNVKKQNEMYTAAINEIWERQKQTLSDPTTHEDSDVLDTTNEDDRFNPTKSADHTSAPPMMDDGRSQLSRFSQSSRSGRRKLKITRKRRAEDGTIQDETVIIDDPQIIRSYIKQRREIDVAKKDIEQELQRLEKNADRRQVREKQGKGKRKKKDTNAGSPDNNAADLGGFGSFSAPGMSADSS